MPEAVRRRVLDPQSSFLVPPGHGGQSEAIVAVPFVRRRQRVRVAEVSHA